MSDGTVRIGISGWRYAGWRGKYYPDGLPQRSELAYVAERLDAVEINGSFYSLQRPESWRRWARETPEDFVFSVKGSRFITHMKRLNDPLAPLANFFAQGLLQLGPKLGPILWQLPERSAPDHERFAAFFELLPRDTGEALSLAAEHDHRVDGRTWIGPVETRPIRHAVEIRNPDLVDRGFMDLLREHDIAWVLADTGGRWPYAEDLTADFVYVRLHGDTELYASGYTDEALDWWAERIRAWSEGREPGDRQVVSQARPPHRPRDVWVFFDNDAKVHAPFDAERLRDRLQVLVPA